MAHKYLILTIVLFFGLNVTPQVLYSENFDSQTSGALNTDLTGTTPGKGNWYTLSQNSTLSSSLDIEITPLTFNNKILDIKNILNSKDASYANLDLKNLDVLWNNRKTGNNILKFEFDFQVNMIDTANYRLRIDHLILYKYGVLAQFRYFATTTYNHNGMLDGYFKDSKGGFNNLYFDNNSTYQYQNFPNNTWVKFTWYFNYKTGKAHCHIPALNTYFTTDFDSRFPLEGFRISVSRGIINQTSTYRQPFLMYDNFNIEAVNNVPLSTNEFLNSKFEIYPNPTVDIITIKNDENILIKNIDIIDLNGRIIKSIKLEEQNTTLNIDFLASGTYLLNIKTDQGTAVKRIVKK